MILRNWGRPGAVVLGLFAFALGAGAQEGPATYPAPRPVVLDIAPLGDYDDLVTLWLAALSPEIELLGVVVGGDSISIGMAAAARALDLVGRSDVGVYPGRVSDAPLPDFPYWSQFPRRKWRLYPELWRFGQGHPIPAADRDGVSFLEETIPQRPGEVTVMITHSLTTLAEAMRRAEVAGQGAAFRGAIGAVYFSGGDFATSEYNIYIDIPSAQRVFQSGVPIYQFGGEDRPKAKLRHPQRRRLWEAATPLSAALYELYGYWHAGYDPTSPFVPILYDVHLPAYLVAGERICRFAPSRVRITPEGFLVEDQENGSPILRRIENHPEALLDLVIDRLTSPVTPALHHLQALQRALGDSASPSPTWTVERSAAEEPRAIREIASTLDSVEAALPPQGSPAGTSARRHLDIARRYLLRRPGIDIGPDPYTDAYIPAYLLWVRLPKKPIAAGVLATSLALVALWRLAAHRRLRENQAP